MASKYTRESIRLAMMEQVCQGLEGHRPRDFKVHPSPHKYYVMFQCEKCKLYVNVRDMELELEGDAGQHFDFGLPGPTPPYP